MPRRASIAIHILLAVQILIPVHYYACNGDKRDERFAWRMFSSTRVEKCSAQFFIGDATQAIRASTQFHNAWVGIAQRGRKQVIAKMAEKLCEKNPGQAVRVRVQCEQFPGAARGNTRLLYNPAQKRSTDQVELAAAGIFDFCTTGDL